jgi:hypothetical protein
MLWLSYQLHANELLLTGQPLAQKHFGPLGKVLNKVEERSGEAFKPIESKMPP